LRIPKLFLCAFCDISAVASQTKPSPTENVLVGFNIKQHCTRFAQHLKIRVAESEIKYPIPTPTFPKFPTPDFDPSKILTPVADSLT